MSDNAMKDFISALFGQESQTLEKTAAEKWLTDLASKSEAKTAEVPDTNTPVEDKMGVKEKLMSLETDELLTVVNAALHGGEEKTAESDMDVEKAAEILNSISAERLEEALKSVEKTAEEDLSKMTALEYLQKLGTQDLEKEAEGEEIDLEKISAADFIKGVESGEIVVPDLEKEAEGEEIDLEKISAADFIKGVESGEIVVPDLEKEAEGDEVDLEKISAADFIKGVESGEIVIPDLEKEAETGEPSLEDISYRMGEVMSEGLMDSLYEANEAQEKTASENVSEEDIKAALVEILAEELEKTAGKAPAMIDNLLKFFGKGSKKNVQDLRETFGAAKGFVQGKGKEVATYARKYPTRTGAAGALMAGTVAVPMGYYASKRRSK